jgi:hypothetical protein
MIGCILIIIGLVLAVQPFLLPQSGLSFEAGPSGVKLSATDLPAVTVTGLVILVFGLVMVVLGTKVGTSHSSSRRHHRR